MDPLACCNSQNYMYFSVLSYNISKEFVNCVLVYFLRNDNNDKNFQHGSSSTKESFSYKKGYILSSCNDI